jgi:hypothetical protein
MGRKSIITALLFLTAYIGIYAGLSCDGAYVPSTFGLNGIKSWIWAPHGFVDKAGAFRRPMFIVFSPLWWLDHRFLHNDWTGLSGPHRP